MRLRGKRTKIVAVAVGALSLLGDAVGIPAEVSEKVGGGLLGALAWFLRDGAGSN
jgi:hypothetical protein